MSSRLPRLRSLATAALAVAVPAALAVAAVAPAASAGTHRPNNGVRQTNLVSDLGNVGAQVVDPNLKNPWGLAFGGTTPLWVADNSASGSDPVRGAPRGRAPAQKVPPRTPGRPRTPTRPARCSTRPAAPCSRSKAVTGRPCSFSLRRAGR